MSKHCPPCPPVCQVICCSGGCDGDNWPRAGAPAPGCEASESQEHSTPLEIRCFGFPWVILGVMTAPGKLVGKREAPGQPNIVSLCWEDRQSPRWDWSPSSSAHTSWRLLCALSVEWLRTQRNSFLWQERRNSSPCFDLRIVLGDGECGALVPPPAEGLQLSSSPPQLWWQWEGAPGWGNWGTPVLAACAPLSWTELLASLRAQPVVPRTCGSVLAVTQHLQIPAHLWDSPQAPWVRGLQCVPSLSLTAGVLSCESLLQLGSLVMFCSSCPLGSIWLGYRAAARD